jgi:HAD superfamily hydrolase (TIGR01509 family)
VVFDLDGTLVVEELDFEAMRREIGLPPRTPLLEAVERMTGPRRAAAEAVLRRHEEVAARGARLNPGVAAFLAWLDGHGVRRAVLSRNMRSAVATALARCGLSFDTVVAREDAPYKPSPQGLWRICAAWGLAPAEVLMVGDYLYDLQAGRAAGTRTALLTHGRLLPFAEEADLVFPTFEEIPDLLRRWVEGDGGSAAPAKAHFTPPP